ncbi:MAG TPA: DinB family protein [Gemmatimonadaceae bacterium]
MFTSVDQFIDTWKHEKEFTHKVFAGLTDQSLTQAVEPAGRTLGRIGWHLTQSIPEMMNRTGLHLGGPEESEAPPSSASTLVDSYDASAQSLQDAVQKNWTDDKLHEVDDMYGEKWKKGETLMVLVMHQAHHRGQMTVLMRQAGLRVPSFYGPAREDWATWGMPEPAI